MTPPLGYHLAKKGLVCKLNKSLYGFRQASRQWFCKFSTTLLAHGFAQSRNDYFLLTFGSSPSLPILLVYLDDIVLDEPNFTKTVESHALLSVIVQTKSSCTLNLHQVKVYCFLQLILLRFQHKGLLFPSTNSLALSVYVDVDCGSCVDTRRSTTDFYLFLGDVLVYLKAKLQPTVSKSFAEAEYMALSSAASEVV
ncbi:uncharacterized protein [Cicer arietinum]|uniref:uncharacterized protein n=1 Tax=Cicer arietinum TaxID=3827 RepID=UPI00064145F1